MATFEREIRALQWMDKVIHRRLIFSKRERAKRLLEEALEAAQASGVTSEEADDLRLHVYSRPVGELQQELAGVAVCLRAYTGSLGLDADDLFDREMARIEDPEVMAVVKQKQQQKAALGISEQAPTEEEAT